MKAVLKIDIHLSALGQRSVEELRKEWRQNVSVLLQQLSQQRIRFTSGSQRTGVMTSSIDIFMKSTTK